jgi:hypothetical protein
MQSLSECSDFLKARNENRFYFFVAFSVVAMAQQPGRFRATGNMTTGRYQHTATFHNGKILIAGGNTLVLFRFTLSCRSQCRTHSF